VFTLAIGIGANVTLVGAISQLLLRAPDHVRDPERVVRLLAVTKDRRGTEVAIGAANYPLLLDVQREGTAFEAVAGVTSRQMSLGTGTDAIDVRASLVSAGFFSLLGAKPLLGHTFSQADGFPLGESPGGPPLAVLGYALWQGHYAGDSTIVGHSVRVGDGAYTITAVMPPGFRGVDAEAPDLWLPVSVAAAELSASIDLSDRMRYSLSLIARLKANATRALAEQQAAAIWNRGDDSRRLGRGAPATRMVAASIIRGRGPDAPREVRVTLWLGGVSALVLLIACANVANLLLGRAISRRHEIAVRLALGAERGRLARQMLTEGVLLAAVSAVAALCLATLARPVLGLLLNREASGTIVNARLFAFTAIIALGTGLLISLIPALQNVRTDEHIADLRGDSSSTSRRASRLRHALLATQSALCMAMLVAAGLFALSLKRVAALDLGLDVAHTVRAIVNLDNLLMSNDAVQATYDDMLQRVRSIPGVASAALASSDPYLAGRAVGVHTVEHNADFFWPPGVAQIAMEAAVGDGFFRTVGARSLRGRDFERGDDPSASSVAVINAPLARILFGDKDALGQCIILPRVAKEQGAACVTVVGVLSGVWYTTMVNREKPMVYIPLAQRTAYDGVWRPQGVFVRVHGEPGAVVEEIRRALQSTRSDLPAVRVTMMRDVAAAEMRPWRLGAAMFGLFGAVALLVAIVGLYGVVAFGVAQRSYEIAVRLALGARRQDILATTAGEGLAAVAVGLAVGAAAAVGVRRWVGPLLFQTSPDDPRLILGLAALLFGVGFAAILLPTRRAQRLDLGRILRTG
jgi:predicted permease